jgi:hypothetical protein
LNTALAIRHQASQIIQRFTPTQRAYLPQQQGGSMDQQYDVIIAGLNKIGRDR